jgi:hypothetical protein
MAITPGLQKNFRSKREEAPGTGFLFLKYIAMTKLILTCALFQLLSCSLHGQARAAAVSNAVADTSQLSFLERYFQIRDTYPALAEVHYNYAGSNNTLESFTKRYY